MGQNDILRWLLLGGACVHLGLLPVSLAVPQVLHWGDELSKLRPFMQRLVWTYGGFIVLANVGFGILTVVGVDDMVQGTTLGTAFAGFVSLYWIIRLVVQYAYFDWSDFPQSRLNQAGRILLDLLFLYLVLVYGWAFVRQFTSALSIRCVILL